MEDVFSFNPSPKKSDEKVSYKKKPVEEWGWKDFQNYFDDEYWIKLGKIPPALAVAEFGKRKKMIESSVEHWGKLLFKSMIDWLLADGHKHNEWTHISMSLVCGKHYWANYIAEQAQNKPKSRLVIDDEE